MGGLLEVSPAIPIKLRRVEDMPQEAMPFHAGSFNVSGVKVSGQWEMTVFQFFKRAMGPQADFFSAAFLQDFFMVVPQFPEKPLG